MRAIIKPSRLSGELTVPASKSAMQRACALALLHEGETRIDNPGKSNDDLAAIGISRALGAVITAEQDSLVFTSKGVIPVEKIIQCGESGLSFRMFTTIAGISSQAIEIHGSGSLLSRPISFFEDVLPSLGITVESHSGKLPLKLTGPLHPRSITVDGSLSSQYLTGILIAYAAITKERVVVTVTNLTSKPYVDLTIQMMEKFGYKVENEQYSRFVIYPVVKEISSITYRVESDWSSAAPILVAGAVAGEIRLAGLDINSAQADRQILKVLELAGADIEVQPGAVSIQHTVLKPFDFDATECPDLFPPLAALAVYCPGTSVIRGTQRLLHKESNRALAIKEEFGKMNIEVLLVENTMIINGGRMVTGNAVFSHHDHRIAMACAVLALGGEGETTINSAEAVSKSYPGFFTDLQMLGASVSLQS